MTAARALLGGALAALCLAVSWHAVPTRAEDAPPAGPEAPPARAAASEETTPPPARPEGRPVKRQDQDEPVPGTVPEPEGYHGEPYQSPVPATLRGAEVIGDAAARALWLAGIAFIDLLPTPVKPPNLPAGTLWRDPPHDSIPDAFWLANTGYDGLDPATERAFFEALERIARGRLDTPMVFFCKQDCWMSWNGAKRAVIKGYTRVFWYPGGTDGWTASGGALAPAKPYVLSGDAAPAPG